VPWGFILISLSCEVNADKTTQALLIPNVLAGEDVSSVSVLGVASDGSGMTTYLYFRHDPGHSNVVKGLNLLIPRVAKADEWECYRNCLGKRRSMDVDRC
jgi:hypothetical protein